jgi:RimJ/RimL family protein N-acetyltransferase
MLIRTLEPGEERMWVQCGAPPNDVDDRLMRFVDHRANYPEDPLCFLVAIEKNRCIGKLRGFFVHRDLYVVNHLVVEADSCYTATGGALLAFAVAGITVRHIEAANWSRPEDAAFDALLRDNGFQLFIEKVFVRRSLIGFSRTTLDPFVYRSLSDIGRDPFLDVMSQVNTGNLNRDIGHDPPDIELDDLIGHAGAAFDARCWKVAYAGNEPAGLVLPQIYPDSPDEGSIFHFGLIPAFRGRGYGRILHETGLAALQQAGAEKYVGSTDVMNIPMVRVFAANGCATVGIRRLYRFHGSDQL